MVKHDKEAMLYYLFMAADGEISYSEEKLFDQLCRELNIIGIEKDEIIAKCKTLMADNSNILNIIKIQKFEEAFRENKSQSATIMWNLINLGYADKYYSDQEKAIVNYFFTKWDVSTGVFQEMIDTANTMLALTKQKGWVFKNYEEGKEKDDKDREIDIEIRKCIDNIKLTIEELTM